MLQSMNGCECVCVNFLNTDNFPASKPKLQISITKTGVWCFRSFNFIGKIFNVIMKKRKLTFDGLPFLSHLNLPVFFSNHHLESQNKNSKSNPDEEACHLSSAPTRIISTILVSALLVVVGLYHICKACCKRGNDNYYYFYYYFLKNFKQLFLKIKVNVIN